MSAGTSELLGNLELGRGEPIPREISFQNMSHEPDSPASDLCTHTLDIRNIFLPFFLIKFLKCGNKVTPMNSPAQHGKRNKGESNKRWGEKPLRTNMATTCKK